MLGRLYLCGCKMDEMTPRHRSMMRALVSGKTPSFVADIFKITESQLSEIMHSPLFKEEMAALEKELEKRLIEVRAQELIQEDPDKILKEATELAAQTLKGALNDPNVHGRIKASIEVLNRAREISEAAGEKVEPSQGFKDMMERCMKETQDNGSKGVLETKDAK